MMCTKHLSGGHLVCFVCAYSISTVLRAAEFTRRLVNVIGFVCKAHTLTDPLCRALFFYSRDSRLSSYKLLKLKFKAKFSSGITKRRFACFFSSHSLEGSVNYLALSSFFPFFESLLLIFSTLKLCSFSVFVPM